MWIILDYTVRGKKKVKNEFEVTLKTHLNFCNPFLIIHRLHISIKLDLQPCAHMSLTPAALHRQTVIDEVR